MGAVDEDEVEEREDDMEDNDDQDDTDEEDEEEEDMQDEYEKEEGPHASSEEEAKKKKKKRKNRDAAENNEPSILEERYRTKRDNLIRETDVPAEKLLEEVTGPIPAKEPKFEEAEWTCDQNPGYQVGKKEASTEQDVGEMIIRPRSTGPTHIQDNVNDTRSEPNRSAAAMVPVESPDLFPESLPAPRYIPLAEILNVFKQSLPPHSDQSASGVTEEEPVDFYD